jgi:hypothetical protein
MMTGKDEEVCSPTTELIWKLKKPEVCTWEPMNSSDALLIILVNLFFDCLVEFFQNSK